MSAPIVATRAATITYTDTPSEVPAGWPEHLWRDVEAGRVVYSVARAIQEGLTT